MEIDKGLYKEIKEYCDLNNLKPRDYIHDLLKRAFMEDKYGKIPPIFTPKEIRENDKKFEKFVDEVGPEKYADIVNECLFGDDDVTKNDVSDKQEAVPAKKDDSVSGKVARTEESGQNVSINVPISENVEKKDKNLDNKPKKRTIKPIK